MTPERYQRLKLLLQQALELAAPERRTFIEQACGPDTDLREQLQSLVLHHDAVSAPADAHSRSPRAPADAPFPRIPVDSVVHSLHDTLELGQGVRLSELPQDRRLPKLAEGADKYELLELIGEGGMGRVYLAYERDLERLVALKMLREGSGQLAARFLEEAQVMGQLQHPAIVTVLELGVAPGDKLFYTMPLVRGQSLHELFEGLRAGEERHSLTRLIQIYIQIVQAVAYAHDKGVLHRDLKPANVMLGEHGEVQLLDWGLAKLLGGSRVKTHARGELTRKEIVLGTPAYMGPEQALGLEVDARTDIYALGVLLYELLTLERPFAGSSMEVLIAQVSEEPVAPRARAPERQIPPELERVCLRAMRKPPEERYQVVGDLLEDVQTWLESEADLLRRRQLAEARTEEASQHFETQRALFAQVAELESELAATSRRFEPWQPAAEKTELFALEDRLEAARDELVRASSRLVTTLTAAVGLDNRNPRARELFADYYWWRFQEAEAAGDRRTREFYAELVARYHDGKYARELLGHGSLTLDSDPSGAEAWLYTYRERDCVLEPQQPRRLGKTPLPALTLAMGSYLVVLKYPGRRDTLYPVFISRNRHWQGKVRLYADAEIGEGFVYVPAGDFIMGGDKQARSSHPRSEPWVDDYLIACDPVTMQEYLEFLNQLALRDGVAAALKRAPRPGPNSTAYVRQRDDGRLELPEVDQDGDPWDPRMPAVSVSWTDALAYCEWRSERDGRRYRLPSEQEWEKAARGVDGRSFPWGNRFDPSLCNMRDSLRERCLPVRVDAFPSDLSPYRVRGMGGNAIDWTSTVVREGTRGNVRVGQMVRGGAWRSAPPSCHCTTLYFYTPDSVYADLAFRLAADVPGRAGGGAE